MVDVARPFFDDAGEIVVPDDYFLYGFGVYASYYRYIDGVAPELVVFKMINLDGRKLGKGLEDYCFLFTGNDMTISKAKQRRENGKADPHAISTIRLAEMIPIGMLEEFVLRGSLFKNEKALSGLYYHDRTSDGVVFESENAAVAINSSALVLSEEKELEFFSSDGAPEK